MKPVLEIPIRQFKINRSVSVKNFSKRYEGGMYKNTQTKSHMDTVFPVD